MKIEGKDAESQSIFSLTYAKKNNFKGKTSALTGTTSSSIMQNQQQQQQKQQKGCRSKKAVLKRHKESFKSRQLKVSMDPICSCSSPGPSLAVGTRHHLLHPVPADSSPDLVPARDARTRAATVHSRHGQAEKRQGWEQTPCIMLSLD